MKACSFVPAATRMIYDMGLEEHLSGVTFECVSDRPKIVHSILEGNHYTSAEIDRVVSEYAAADKSPYYVDMELLQSIQPDVAFTQHVCDVCQIGTSYVERALGSLTRFPTVIPLVPRNLEDILDNALSVAEALGQADTGRAYVAGLKERIARVIDVLRSHGAPLRRVMVMEWMNPVYNCGHWIPYQISIAGGVDMLSNPSGYSVVTSWEKVVQYNPEVLVIAPCGFDVARAAQEVSQMTQSGWNDLQAVIHDRVYVADADMFTQPSASTVIDGVEVLASLFHPDIFELPESLRHKVSSLANLLPTSIGTSR
ncbi:ABC transporter substrate-binding protein [Alicyclobacillus dauci]|uniref:ABC transporter substrate-binding protein n=1 Tax=Alicyclobacillus dauci TaxID=1475485 RepID=A0ABY6Z048_9BACL|nr:ABC transporter substrate-binding protein [Alicyclobacillus dauci]WAH36263.1 ABC transporter substrate-binding protein [Alicyclobacillus dauci]WAH39415.1 ABC transporter substrate-binding protein [Alicyclobacillus dauci]